MHGIKNLIARKRQQIGKGQCLGRMLMHQKVGEACHGFILALVWIQMMQTSYGLGYFVNVISGVGSSFLDSPQPVVMMVDVSLYSIFVLYILLKSSAFMNYSFILGVVSVVLAFTTSSISPTLTITSCVSLPAIIFTRLALLVLITFYLLWSFICWRCSLKKKDISFSKPAKVFTPLVQFKDLQHLRSQYANELKNILKKSPRKDESGKTALANLNNAPIDLNSIYDAQCNLPTERLIGRLLYFDELAAKCAPEQLEIQVVKVDSGEMYFMGYPDYPPVVTAAGKPNIRRG